MFRQSVMLLTLMLALLLWLLPPGQRMAAEGETNVAYVPLIFNNYPPPPPQRFFDDFSDSSRPWFSGTDEALEAGRVDGEYHIRVKENATMAMVISPAEFGVMDYTLEIDVRQVDGADIAYGMVLDWLDWDAFDYSIVLVVPGAGRYAVLHISNGRTDELIPWTTTNSLIDGLNHISIERRGTRLSLALNGISQFDMRDLGYLNATPIRTGLAVLTIGGDEVTGGFDNYLLVEAFPEGSAAHQFQQMPGPASHVERVAWRPR